jgi:hypothetical protein
METIKLKTGYWFLSTLLAVSAGGVMLMLSARSEPHGAARAPVATERATEVELRDQPLGAAQVQLLELAFQAASALPLKPHHKNRSRAQAAVVDTCLELDQPERALAWLEQIGDWRRGAAHADYALYCAEHGNRADALQHIELALKVAEAPVADDAQEWPRHRIRAKIAQTYLALGDATEAASLEAGLIPSETGAIDAAKAASLDAEAFDERIRELDEIVAVGDFEQVRNVLETLARLFERFYADAERRALVEAKLESSWTQAPIQLRAELMMQLVRSALEHDDRPKALELVAKTRAILDGSTWTPELAVQLDARLAALRHEAGERAEARRDADAVLARFEAQRDQIVDMFRARTLRPLAEALQAMGDSAGALRVYRLALDEGALNPNARPRAEDLSATCLSMATHGVEPDAELREHIARIGAGLQAPW